MLNYDWVEDNSKFYSMISRKQIFCAEALKKVVSNEKAWFKKYLPTLPIHANVFMFMLLPSNHTVFSFDLKVICTCEFSKMQKLHSPKSAF